MTKEETYMREAIRQAKKAASIGEVPIGCVIVYEDTIIARGYNRRIADKNVLAHAEIIAVPHVCGSDCAGPHSHSDHRMYESQGGVCRFGSGYASSAGVQSSGGDGDRTYGRGVFRPFKEFF